MTKVDWNEIKYFKSAEFGDEPDSGDNMNPEFVILLDSLRGLCGFPLRVNSGYRTIEQNRAAGGAPQSAHRLGLAVDIHCTDWNTRRIIVKFATHLLISEIALGKTFIHLGYRSVTPLLAFYNEKGKWC